MAPSRDRAASKRISDDWGSRRYWAPGREVGALVAGEPAALAWNNGEALADATDSAAGYRHFG